MSADLATDLTADVVWHLEGDTLLLVPRLLRAGQPLVDFERYALDLDALVASQCTAGELPIFTCWCGVPECAGLHRGVQVTHPPGAVCWTLSAPEACAGTHCFAAAGYRAAITQLLAELDAQLGPATAGDGLSLVPASAEKYLKEGTRMKAQGWADFARVVHAAACQAGCGVGRISEPSATPNFYAAELTGRGGRCVLLHSVDGHWACAESFQPLTPTLTFVDAPAPLARALAALGVGVLSAAELNGPFRPTAQMSAADIRYWKPQTLGAGLFNWWD